MTNEIPKSDYLSSGSTLLNLATSGTPYGSLTKGRYFWMVGDSSSGKTFLTLTFLAEASINREFDNYDLIFDNAEDGALMEVEKYYGAKLAARLKPPRVVDGEPAHSQTIEDFYFNLDDLITASKKKGGRPFIYLLDSMDALSSVYEGKKFNEKKNAARKAKEGAKVKGDYGDGKAKINSTYIRRIVAELRDTGSIVIILSQTRDNVGGDLFDPKSTHAGGHALKFYATWQLWSSVGPRIKRKIHGIDRQIGITSRIAIKKNRLTGKEWTISLPIYWNSGIDDVGACVQFLIDEKHWIADKAGDIEAEEFDFEGAPEDLIQKIERDGLEVELRDIVTQEWRQIEAACAVQRKSRYS